MQKLPYLNNKIYLILLESLVNMTDEGLSKYSNKNNRIKKIDDILNNPSKFLLEKCKIFKTPEFLNKIIFDIDELEFMFTDISIKNIKENKDIIKVKRVIDNQDTNIQLKDIVKSFKKGCLVDCHED